MRKVREAEMVTPRSLNRTNNGPFLKMQRMTSDNLRQMTPRNKILPPLHAGRAGDDSASWPSGMTAPGGDDSVSWPAGTSIKTLQKLVSSENSMPRAASDRGFPKRSCVRVLESHTKAGNSGARSTSIQLAADLYDRSAAELVRSERSHRTADMQMERTPLDNCRGFIRSHKDVQGEGTVAEGIYKRQFCLPVQSVDAETVWSRPILVYGEGATGVSKEFPDSLAFDSAFESGNLLSAHRIGALEYELLLHPDHATTGHTQWYLFSVGNAVGGCTYHFHITNLNKPDSLYGAGQQPLFFSSHAFSREGKGWQRVGKDVKYVKNGRRRNGRPLFTLSFAVEFPHDGDKCVFAHCFPYTFTDLTKYLKSKQLSGASQFVFNCDVLCQTLAGNACHLLTITANGTPEELAARKGIFLSARVHPGESNSSLIMKGILDFLTGTSAEAASLRSACVFKIIPMLNPDGVVNGHYRCNLAGYDLNRHWHWPSRKKHPTIYCAKEMLREFCKEREVEMFVDIHGHSVKHNMFMYGCPAKPKKDNDLLPPPSPKAFVQLLQTKSPHFSWRDSKFSTEKSKEHTGRVVVYREFDVQNSYTLEASLCGAGDGKTSKHQFSAHDFEAMGTDFCLTLAEYCSTLMQQNFRRHGKGSVLDRHASLRQLLAELAIDPALVPALAPTDTETASAQRDADDAAPETVLAQPPSDHALQEAASAEQGGAEAGKRLEPSSSGGEEEAGGEGGDSSSDDEDRILDVEEEREEQAAAAPPAPSKGDASELQAQPSPKQVPVTHLRIQIPARPRACSDAAASSLSSRPNPGHRSADWEAQEEAARPPPHCHSLIPFPPAEEPGSADGRRLVFWDPSPRFREKHSSVPAAKSPAAAAPLPAREPRRERRRGEGGGWETDRGVHGAAQGGGGQGAGGQGAGGQGAGGQGAGGALGGPPRTAALESVGARGGHGQAVRALKGREARAGAGPAAPRPPTMGAVSPRHVTQQPYARESHEAAPLAARASFYAFPPQRRVRHAARAETGERGLLIRSTAGSEPYTGPPGIYVGGRWHQSAKPVGPSSKFLPIMLGAVPPT